MASGVNKVILIGNLGGDPEKKVTPGGDSVCEFRIATNESWTDKQGQKQERTEWHRIVAWGKKADVCATYLKKGRQVYVEGKIRTRSWEDDSGNKKYMTEVVAHDVQFLGGGGDREERSDSGKEERNGGKSDRGRKDEPPPAQYGGVDDDIPF